MRPYSREVLGRVGLVSCYRLGAVALIVTALAAGAGPAVRDEAPDAIKKGWDDLD
jgi:hypothetical protein